MNARCRAWRFILEMSNWIPFDDGQSIGQTGSEGGFIERDEEHVYGARITLESEALTPFAITCGVYGWMVHTRFFSDEAEAQVEFEKMKDALEEVLEFDVSEREPDEANKTESVDALSARISEFVDRFP